MFGIVALTNALLPLLRQASAGRIVNVSSEVGSIESMSDPDGVLAELVSIPYPSSKTALNMVTAMYAKELAGTPLKVNAANPGYCATDLNGHRGFRTSAEGAEVIVGPGHPPRRRAQRRPLRPPVAPRPPARRPRVRRAPLVIRS